LFKKIFKYAFLTVVCLLVLIPASALVYRAWLQHRVAEHRAIDSPHGIDTLDAVPIGGIRQWIQVRGQNVDNPILLFIHGGPGIAFIPLSRSFQGPWEQNFTVVQWDQRGAGKTYATNNKALQQQTMNVAQMESDTVAVVDYLRARFHRDKIFVVGHSWGSVLGLWLAHEHPDRIYAFVGVGQMVNMEQNDRVAYHDALAQATQRGNSRALRDLENIAPYPPASFDFGKEQTARHWEGELLGPPLGPGSFTDVRRLLTDLISTPEYSLRDDLGFLQGQQASIQIFAPQVEKIDLMQLGSSFSVPIFFFEGRRDPYCRPALILQYADSISAPSKQTVWFENSGHFPFYEDKDEFTRQLVARLLPLAANPPPGR
jgi:pimeloyl-ACP methyl ester carboxylesterase